MNWRRGLLRLWAFASSIWISFWAGYYGMTCRFAEFDGYICPVNLFRDVSFLHRDNLVIVASPILSARMMGEMIVMFLGVPIVAFVIGYGCLWTLRGFHANSSKGP